MTRLKAFWLSFVITLCAMAPIMLIVTAYTLSTRPAPVDTAQSGVPIARPSASDAKTVLVMTGAQTPETFVLVRFDALQNKISVTCLPPQTVLLAEGAPVLLSDAVATAGPIQGMASIHETLGVAVDHYLFASGKLLGEMMSALGGTRLRLANYMSEEAMGQLQLTVPGATSIALSPQIFYEVLSSKEVPDNTLAELRAAGYLAFLRAGSGALENVLPAQLRKNSARYSTNISATDWYDYERILKFLDKQEPTYMGGAMPGVYTGSRFELTADALTLAQEYFGLPDYSATGQSAPDNLQTAQDSAAPPTSAENDDTTAVSSAHTAG